MKSGLFFQATIFFILIICIITSCSNIGKIDQNKTKPAQANDSIKAEYKIEDKIVSAEKFDEFKLQMKELSETWFCAETKEGGITGYDMISTKGIVYEFRAESINGFSKISLKKKAILK